ALLQLGVRHPHIELPAQPECRTTSEIIKIVLGKGALLAVAGRCFGIAYATSNKHRWVIGTASRIDTGLARGEARLELGNIRALETGPLQIICQRLQLHGDGFELRVSDIEIAV